MKDRLLGYPAVEIAATRNAEIARKQQFAQKMLSIFAACPVLIVGHFFARIGLVTLGVMVLSGMVCASTIKRWREFGEQYRLMAKLVDNFDKQQAGLWRIAIKSESRSLIARIIVSVVFALGIVIWSVKNEGNLLVVLPCIIFLAFVLSSIKPIFSDASSFRQSAVAAQKKGCKIVLFRSFEEKSSSLARSALVPILTGYGMVEIVLDETYAHTEAHGIFGKESAGISDLYRLHRFTNAAWKGRVAEIIRDCDIAIIDLTRISPGVMWELAHCYENLPPYRIYGVINAAGFERTSFQDHMAHFYDTLGAHPEMPDNVHPYIFVFEPSAWNQEGLATDIHRKMVEIIAVEKGGQDAAQYYGGL